MKWGTTNMAFIREDELISRKLKICENCEWCVPTLNCEFPHCLLTGKQMGLFETCNLYKDRTGMHISM